MRKGEIVADHGVAGQFMILLLKIVHHSHLIQGDQTSDGTNKELNNIGHAIDERRRRVVPLHRVPVEDGHCCQGSRQVHETEEQAYDEICSVYVLNRTSAALGTVDANRLLPSNVLDLLSLALLVDVLPHNKHYGGANNRILHDTRVHQCREIAWRLFPKREALLTENAVGSGTCRVSGLSWQVIVFIRVRRCVDSPFVKQVSECHSNPCLGLGFLQDRGIDVALLDEHITKPRPEIGCHQMHGAKSSHLDGSGD